MLWTEKPTRGREEPGRAERMPQMKRRTIWGVLLIVLSLGLLATAAVLAAGGDISTVAGTGTQGFSGDGGPATSAKFNRPIGIAVDSSGNLFIADRNNERVRKVDTSGNISTVAGNGTNGFSGDGGPATTARLNLPRDVAVDSSGNLFIADRSNHRVRKVDTSGDISTVAGDGTNGFSGDGGQATSTQLNFPNGVTVDSSGNLFIADQANHRIRKVDTSGIIITVAGTSTSGFLGDGVAATSTALNQPSDVAVDSSGNLFIADEFNHRIRKVDISGIITTVAGNGTQGFSGDGGPATSAKLDTPTGVAVDASGNIFFADSSNHRIRKVDTSGIITTVAGDGTQGFSGDGGSATSAQLDFANDVAVDSSGNLFITDINNERVRKVEMVVGADLAVTKTDSPDPITAAGATLTYTLTVTNGGPSTSINVVLTDPLPSGITFVSATLGQGSCSGTSTVTCNLGTLANGATTTVTIKVTVDHGFNGITTNTASVTATQNDPNSSDDSATATTTVSAPAVIPGLSQWGLLALGVLLAVLLVWAVRRRVVKGAGIG